MGNTCLRSVFCTHLLTELSLIVDLCGLDEMLVPSFWESWTVLTMPMLICSISLFAKPSAYN